MKITQKRISFIAICHLAAALLFGVSSFTSASQIYRSDDISAVKSVVKTTSLDHLHQREYGRFPDLPNELPSEQIESNDENNEKDGSEDDYYAQHNHLNFLFALFSENSSSYGVTAEIGGAKIPLFLLFHCWKKFLA